MKTPKMAMTLAFLKVSKNMNASSLPPHKTKFPKSHVFRIQDKVKKEYRRFLNNIIVV